ncbi:hypothetical protein G6F70_000283 [Rhizopus microsporus]|nr:hypothetical protein G6F71_001198 [Rhizopus microsporus]KAG1204679.1 hypothetical protein G6F70_000283 [Rhizopus microsporus]KAG1216171.1 hypothetical protein G6F69_000362 [Rhizopus microsporus]KAG1226638.1 hypothetical protein G6F67_008889 [Rhizopus microsporus]KAG1269234.1 hypothetical protein G6F68_000480 [Rhizopus microsporus]
METREDLNYVDEESELSSGEISSSDLDLSQEPVVHTPRKRGRPKVQGKEKTPTTRESSQSYVPPPANTSSGYASEIDEIGETKVDKNGRLLGGREYRVPTFTLPTRGETLFMFSKDPAALLGFRDSFVFLKKNVNLVKVHIDNAEKGYLVDSRLLRSTFRTREISVVTARSVFKQFGHRVIRKGRKGRDDYFYTEEVDEGDDDALSDDGMKDLNDMNYGNNNNNSNNFNKPMSTGSAWGTMNNGAQSFPATVMGKNSLQHKSTIQYVDELNWVHCAAVAARQFNNSLFMYRRSNPTTYDLLTNVYQIPENKQAFTDNQAIIKKELDNNNNSNNTLDNPFIY